MIPMPCHRGLVLEVFYSTVHRRIQRFLPKKARVICSGDRVQNFAAVQIAGTNDNSSAKADVAGKTRKARDWP